MSQAYQKAFGIRYRPARGSIFATASGGSLVASMLITNDWNIDRAAALLHDMTIDEFAVPWVNIPCCCMCNSILSMIVGCTCKKSLMCGRTYDVCMKNPVKHALDHLWFVSTFDTKARKTQLHAIQPNREWIKKLDEMAVSMSECKVTASILYFPTTNGKPFFNCAMTPNEVASIVHCSSAVPGAVDGLYLQDYRQSEKPRYHQDGAIVTNSPLPHLLEQHLLSNGPYHTDYFASFDFVGEQGDFGDQLSVFGEMSRLYTNTTVSRIVYDVKDASRTFSAIAVKYPEGEILEETFNLAYQMDEFAEVLKATRNSPKCISSCAIIYPIMHDEFSPSTLKIVEDKGKFIAYASRYPYSVNYKYLIVDEHKQLCAIRRRSFSRTPRSAARSFSEPQPIVLSSRAERPAFTRRATTDEDPDAAARLATLLKED